MVEEEPKMDKLVSALTTKELDLDEILKLRLVNSLVAPKREEKSDIDRILDKVLVANLVDSLKKKDDSSDTMRLLMEMQRQQQEMMMKFMEMMVALLSSKRSEESENLRKMMETMANSMRNNEDEKWRTIVEYLQSLERRLYEAQNKGTGLEGLMEEIRRFQKIKQLIREAEQVLYTGGASSKEKVPEWYGLAKELLDKLEPVLVRLVSKRKPKRPKVRMAPPIEAPVESPNPPRPAVEAPSPHYGMEQPQKRVEPTPHYGVKQEEPKEEPKPKVEESIIDQILSGVEEEPKIEAPIEEEATLEDQPIEEEVVEEAQEEQEPTEATTEEPKKDPIEKEIRELAKEELKGTDWEKLPKEEQEKVLDLMVEDAKKELLENGIEVAEDEEVEDEAEVEDNSGEKE